MQIYTRCIKCCFKILGGATNEVPPDDGTEDEEDVIDAVMRNARRHASYRKTRTTRNLSWPTPNNVTEEVATQKCREAIINSPAYQRCHELFGEAIFDPVVACVADIKVRRQNVKMFQLKNLNIMLGNITCE